MKLTEEEKQWIKNLCDELGIIRVENGTTNGGSANDNENTIHGEI